METKQLFNGALLAAGMAFATASSADLITSSDSNPLEPTEINQTLTLDKFDSNLGTVMSAALTLNVEALSDLMLENTGSQDSGVFQYTASLGMFFSSALGLDIPGTSIFDPTIDLLLWQEIDNIPVGQTVDYGQSNPFDSITLDVTAFLGDLSMAGGGTFDIDCVSLNSSGFQGGGGNLGSVQNTDAACSASIEYDFQPATTTPMPEPTTLALMAMGLLGLGGRQLRRS